MSKLVPTTPGFIAPARDLREVTHNCEDRPLDLGDSRWQDFTLARGDLAVSSLRRELEWRQPESFLHAAFVSHRGAGKSTEILRLTEELAAEYERLYLEATLELDPFDIEMEDLLLALATAVEAHMRDTGNPLPGELIENVANWFKSVVSSTSWGSSFSAEAAAGVEGEMKLPFFGRLFASAKALFKQESSHRTEVKQELKKYPGALLAAVNQLLDGANALLAPRSLLVVVDNLDRYDP